MPIRRSFTNYKSCRIRAGALVYKEQNRVLQDGDWVRGEHRTLYHHERQLDMLDIWDFFERRIFLNLERPPYITVHPGDHLYS